jgi:cytoskeleton protein RodZ
LPLKFKIGNAAATELVFRGQPVPLAGTTRDNVARLELK